MPRQRRRRTQMAVRRKTIRRIAHRLQLALLAIVAIAVVLAAFTLWRNEPTPPATAAVTGTPADAAGATPYPPTPSPTPRRSPTPTRPKPTPVPKGIRVGILAGHSGPQDDPGAICPDGLREADLNLAVAERVMLTLRDDGYDVDLLEEFDARLQGYRADALVAIHSDSCEIEEASGFKVARVIDSAIPDIEDRLVDCLYREYERATSLARHDSSITAAMYGYHAFREIARETPGAIIELGFMAADRNILTHEPERLATGIVNGLICFLER